jgi:hypothetical protein
VGVLHVCNMFGGPEHVPDSLLTALSIKNETLRDLCSKLIDAKFALNNKKAEQMAKRETKYLEWKRKLKVGNERALEQRAKREYDMSMEQQEKVRQYNERYIEQMRGTWDKQMQEYMLKRDINLFLSVVL